jgi:hypothetical protein
MNDPQNNLKLSKILRTVAVIGLVLTTIYKIFSVSDIKQNQVYSFYALILIVVGIGVSLFVLRKTTVQIFKNPDLLVPIGLYVTANTILSFGTKSLSFVGFRDGKLELEGLSLFLVVYFLTQVFISVFFTGWMTRILLQFVESGRVELIYTIQDFRNWLPRTFIYLVVGWIPIYLMLSFMFLPVLLGGSARSSVALLYPFIFLIGISSLFWNLATAALLPYIISTKANLKQSFKEGVQISWANKKKTIIPVLLLMIVSGWIVLISVNYSERIDEKAEFGEVSDSYSIKNTRNFNYATNFVWTGNYPEASKWHNDLLKAVKEEPLSSVSFRIMLLMLILSLVVNLKIIQEVRVSKDYEYDAIEDFFNSKNAPFVTGIVIVLILFLLPIEMITQKLHTSSLLSADSAKIPTTPQIIKGENFLNKQVFFETGQGDTVDVRQKEDTDKFEIRGINDVAVGNFDGEEGQDVVLATGKGSLVLDTNGTIKKEISYQIEEPGKDNLNVFFHKQKIIDIDGDGIGEFLNFDGSDAAEGIYDFQGKLIVKFEHKPSNDK